MREQVQGPGFKTKGCKRNQDVSARLRMANRAPRAHRRRSSRAPGRTAAWRRPWAGRRQRPGCWLPAHQSRTRASAQTGEASELQQAQGRQWCAAGDDGRAAHRLGRRRAETERHITAVSQVRRQQLCCPPGDAIKLMGDCKRPVLFFKLRNAMPMMFGSARTQQGQLVHIRTAAVHWALVDC